MKSETSSKIAKNNSISEPQKVNIQDSKALAMLCAKSAIEKKGAMNFVYEVGTSGAFTDYFFITSGTNERQVQAIADEIKVNAKKSGHSNPKIEGYDEGRWVLVDFGHVVAHVFLDAIRDYYDLESIWKKAPRIEIPEEYFISKSSPETNRANA